MHADVGTTGSNGAEFDYDPASQEMDPSRWIDSIEGFDLLNFTSLDMGYNIMFSQFET